MNSTVQQINSSSPSGIVSNGSNTATANDIPSVTRPTGSGPNGYAPAAPRNGMSTPVKVILGALVVLVVGGIATAAAGWYVFDQAIRQIPTVHVGQLKTDTQSIPLGSPQTLNADVQMGYGTLAIDNNASGSDAFNGTFAYNVPDWQPQVTYSPSTGNLNVHQNNSNGIVRQNNAQARNDWKLHLNSSAPTTLKASIGAGEAALKLGGLKLTDLNVSAGAADLTVDLSGNWSQDMQGTIESGVGQTMLILPKNTGVRVSAERGVGNVSSGDLKRDGSIYTNAAYGHSPATLNITIHQGVGDISLEQR